MCEQASPTVERDRAAFDSFARDLIFRGQPQRKTLDGDFHHDDSSFSIRKFVEEGEPDFYQLVMRNPQGDECAFGLHEVHHLLRGDDGRDYPVTDEQIALMKAVAMVEGTGGG